MAEFLLEGLTTDGKWVTLMRVPAWTLLSQMEAYGDLGLQMFLLGAFPEVRRRWIPGPPDWEEERRTQEAYRTIDDLWGE